MTSTENIRPGDILIDGGTYLPKALAIAAYPNLSASVVRAGERASFGKAIEDAGLTLFFMAGEIRASVFGFDADRSLLTAMKRLLAAAKAEGCNALEITGVTGKSFLKFPYVTVCAHARHLQKGTSFAGPRQSAAAAILSQTQI